jgi:hypothetical protein
VEVGTTVSPTVFNHFYGGGNNWKEDHDPPRRKGSECERHPLEEDQKLCVSAARFVIRI